eukprot:462312_1
MIIKEGYLKKQITAHGTYHPFEKRWVVLEDSFLNCYKSSKKESIAHSIDIDDIIHVTTSSVMCQFEVVRSKRNENITFKAQSTQEMTQWIDSIQNAINPFKHATVEPIIVCRQRSISATTGAVTTTTDENKHLKKQNKSLKRKIIRLKQTIQELTDKLRAFETQTKHKYTEWMVRRVDEEGRQKRKQKRRDSQKLIVPESNGIDKTHNIRKIRKSCIQLKFNHRLKRQSSPKLLSSPSPPVHASPASSDNEFEIDPLSASGTAMQGRVSLMDKVSDVFNRSKSVNESMLMKTLMSESILYDSPMKVYSTSNDAYVDTAGVLTKNNVYLTSAINYRIWSELRQRTKIDELIQDENDNDIKIDDGKAQQMMTHLDLTDDEDIRLSIKNTFIGKTKRELKLNILFNETPIKSLASLFGLNGVMQRMNCRQVHCVIMKGFYDTEIIPLDERDTCIENIFEAIPWTEQQRMNDSIVITLRGYVTQSTVHSINAKANEKRLVIEAYDDKMKYTQYETSVVDVKAFDTVKYNGNIGEDKGFEFVLKCRNNALNIRCLLHSNNMCQEWITHLDYVMADKSYVSEAPSPVPSCNGKDKLMNDFTEDEVHYGFGVYLNYWQNGFDNTVIPTYDTLKQELLHNSIAKISQKDYYELYEACAALLTTKRHEIQAKQIGITNKTFNIQPGEGITINHLIALKLYTDFTEISRLFKRTMRKGHEGERMKQLIARNAEVALWSRYIKESCMFYGNVLRRTVYTGLNRQLWFSSMKQHFECPVSTTLSYNKAQGFCEDDGLILKLRAGNSKTRYFNVSWLSRYPEEQEWLVMGSSLKICDIYMNGADSSKQYIAAILMFEHLMNGQFIDTNMDKERQLYALLHHIIKLNPLVWGYCRSAALPGDVMRLCLSYATEDLTLGCIAQYNIDLLQNVIKEVKTRYEDHRLWINQQEMDKIKFSPLKCMLEGSFFESFGMKRSNVNWVQQYSWNIGNDLYDEFKRMAPRQYILSKHYEYEHKAHKISFYLKCCRQYSEESTKCALFLYLDELPKHIKSVTVEYDLLCRNGNKLYRNLILPQRLSNEKPYCGLQAFSSKSVTTRTSIPWIIGLKVLDVTY